MITAKSVIQFHSFDSSTATNKNGQVNIVRWDTDKTIRVDSNVLPIIYLLSWGKTVKEVSDQIEVEESKVIELLNYLNQQGFIKQIDQTVLKDDSPKIQPWLESLPRQWFSWVLSSIFLVPSFIFIILGVVVGVPYIFGLFSFQSYFWSSDLFVVFITIYLLDYLMTALHEAAHFIATKAVGGEAKITLGYRFIYLVFQTESYHLGVLSKNKRFIVYLAGLFLDFIILALIGWLLYLMTSANQMVGVSHNFLAAAIVVIIWKIIWQFNVALETDIFNLIADDLEMENLRSDAKKLIGLKLKGWKSGLMTPFKRLAIKFVNDQDVLENSDDLRSLNKNERKQVGFYIFLMLIGLLIAAGRYLLFIFPRDLVFLTGSIYAIGLASVSSDFIEIVKNITILTLLGLHYSVLFYLILQERFNSKTNPVHQMA